MTQKTAGSSAPPRRLGAGLTLAALAVLLCLGFAAPAASADATIGTCFSFSECASGGGLSEPSAVAVSAKEGGDLYVVDQARVSEFAPGGQFIRAFGWGVLDGAAELQTCTAASGCQTGAVGSGDGQINYDDEIAVDNDPASPSYGDLYLINQHAFRVEKFDPAAADVSFELMFGGEVDKTTGANLCTAASGDLCGRGVPGSAAGFFQRLTPISAWDAGKKSSLALGPGGTVYVGDYSRVQEFEPSGAYKSQLPTPTSGFVSSLALNAAGDLYALTLPKNEKQALVPPQSGTYTITFKGQTTAPLASYAGEAEIQEALEALSTIGAGNVSVPGGCTFGEAAGEFGECVEFTGSLADREQPLMSCSPSCSVHRAAYAAAGDLVELGPSGEVLGSPDPGGRPTHLALDQQGDLFLSDFGGSGVEVSFRAFRPDGALFAEFASDQVRTNFYSADLVPGIAIGDAAGVLYAAQGSSGFGPAHVAVVPQPAPGAPTVSEERAGDLEPLTATLHVVVNPREFDTSYRFQYITQKAYEEDGNAFGAGTEQTAPADLGSLWRENQVQAAISGLAPATAYRWRVLAESECEPEPGQPLQPCKAEGPAEPLQTLPPVSLREPTTRRVAPEEVTIDAEAANNNSLTRGLWKLCLGPEPGADPAAYSLGCQEGQLKAGSSAFEALAATFTGLRPDTAYHYRLFAENSYTQPGHPVQSADQLLTTEPSPAQERAAESCPNTLLREENSSLALPDCRAYEQVSVPNKEGTDVFPSGALAPSGEAALYNLNGALAGTGADNGIDEYQAHRTAAGWRTTPVLGNPGPGYQFTHEDLFSAGLERWLVPLRPGLGAEDQDQFSLSFALGSQDGVFTPQAIPPFRAADGGTAWEAGAYGGAAADLSRLFLLDQEPLLGSDPRPRLPENGPIVFDRIYEWAGVGTASPSLRLMAEVPPELTGPGCLLWAPGTSGFGFRPSHTYARGFRLASADGSVTVFSEPLDLHPHQECGAGQPNPLGLFALGPAGALSQLDAPPPAQCSAPAPCAGAPPTEASYDAIAPDGSWVWFTTARPLVNSDTDTTNDLYAAKLAEGRLVELLQASAGAATASHPSPGSGARVGDYGSGEQIAERGFVTASQDGSRVAFESPAVLTEEPNALGQSALAKANNLYVYDANTHQLRFVALLCSGPGLSGTEPGPHGASREATAANDVADPACPASLSPFMGEGSNNNDDAIWDGVGNGRYHQALFSADGRYFLFESFGRLTADDTDEAVDLFRYDFQTGALIRVSFGRNGNDADGNDDRFPASFTAHTDGKSPSLLAGDQARPISADGSLVVFETAAPLASADTNAGPRPSCESVYRDPATGQESPSTGCDVYEWEEDGHGTCAEAAGCVRLLSDGRDPHGSHLGILSESGNDVLFHTDADLAAADADGSGDLYDARVGGGFPPPPPPPPCSPKAPSPGSPEACHGPSTQEQLHPNYPSEETRSGGNGPQELKCARGKHKVKKHGQARCVPNRRRHHRKRHRRAPATAGRGGAR